MADATLLHFVFDGPPGPECGRFVECEAPDGRSVNAGEWHERADGYWELRVPVGQPQLPSDDGLIKALEEARLQLEYLDERFPTGTTPAIIARIAEALSRHKAPLSALQVTEGDKS